MVPWVRGAEYRWINNDYKKSYGIIRAVVKKFSIKSLDKSIKSEKFCLGAVKGIFAGVFEEQRDGGWVFILESDHKRFDFTCKNPSTLSWLNKKRNLLKNRTIFVAGVLFFDQGKQKLICS